MHYDQFLRHFKNLKSKTLLKLGLSQIWPDLESNFCTFISYSVDTG